MRARAATGAFALAALAGSSSGLFFQTSPAGAQPALGAARPVSPIAAAVAADEVADAILIGPSGEIYRPAGEHRWHRSTVGGVAADVRSAMSPSAGELLVAGDETPLYLSSGDAWRATPLPERGPVVLAADSGAPALAVGRVVHLRRGRGWQPVTRARGRPSALFASTDDRVYAALQGGFIDKWQGGSWSRIRVSLESGDEIVHLAGQSGRVLYALTQRGAILEVGASAAKAIERAPELQGFTPHAIAVAPDGTLFAAGYAGAADPAQDAPRMVLARRGRSGALAVDGYLDDIAPGDRVTVLLADGAGSVLVATAAGSVSVRAPTGGVTAGRLTSESPPPIHFDGSSAPAYSL